MGVMNVGVCGGAQGLAMIDVGRRRGSFRGAVMSMVHVCGL